ncbi:hypothetical protein Q4543_23525 [Salipiger sp. 1_MG-2023]|uniref:hypothetical protein n=1 Tax=Salipiger sp. 1_MG-2023 TaxID=3062665 RepID=UPI0026E37582|nr:hypothetical protein [Salipiger sp. 1_MG-2023]MDO6588457.1 hypothetical protein [Salipiger sp. 1_MG-2023]
MATVTAIAIAQVQDLLPALRHMAKRCLDQLSDLSRRAADLVAQIAAASSRSSISARVQKMPGTGPIPTMELAAFAPPGL